MERVTITLPVELLEDIDRREKNRARFVAEAVRGELERCRRAELRRSLQNPHSESVEFADREIAVADAGSMASWRRLDRRLAAFLGFGERLCGSHPQALQ